MGIIHKLSPALADMIAAGEVVERPASVIKELVENAVDAGAKKITVEIKNGGITFMRVTDDGCGMSREDAPLRFCAMPPLKFPARRIWGAFPPWASAARRWLPSAP